MEVCTRCWSRTLYAAAAARKPLFVQSQRFQQGQWLSRRGMAAAAMTPEGQHKVHHSGHCLCNETSNDFEAISCKPGRSRSCCI